MNACPYMTQAFSILSKKWCGIILHTLSLSESHCLSFTQLKEALSPITPRALSIRLNELVDLQLIKKVDHHTNQHYQLTDEGVQLVCALKPLEAWAHRYFK